MALSPFLALAQLVMFKRKALPMTESRYEECVDAVVTLLEEVNDESYRLINEERDTWPTDATGIPEVAPAAGAPVQDSDEPLD